MLKNLFNDTLFFLRIFRKAYERHHISPQTIARITENVDEFITVVLEEGSKILLVENRWRSLKVLRKLG